MRIQALEHEGVLPPRGLRRSGSGQPQMLFTKLELEMRKQLKRKQ